jgi:hypothetical protein
MSSPAFDSAMSNLRAAIDAKIAKAVSDATAPAVDAAQTEDAAAVQALANELNPPAE